MIGHLGHPDPIFKTGSADPDPKKFDRIRHTAIYGRYIFVLRDPITRIFPLVPVLKKLSYFCSDVLVCRKKPRTELLKHYIKYANIMSIKG